MGDAEYERLRLAYAELQKRVDDAERIARQAIAAAQACKAASDMDQETAELWRAKCMALTLKWTTERPTEEGEYWMRVEGEPHTKPSVIMVRLGCDNVLKLAGSGIPVETCRFTHFAGPLVAPDGVA